MTTLSAKQIMTRSVHTFRPETRIYTAMRALIARLEQTHFSITPKELRESLETHDGHRMGDGETGLEPLNCDTLPSSGGSARGNRAPPRRIEIAS